MDTISPTVGGAWLEKTPPVLCVLSCLEPFCAGQRSRLEAVRQLFHWRLAHGYAPIWSWLRSKAKGSWCHLGDPPHSGRRQVSAARSLPGLIS